MKTPKKGLQKLTENRERINALLTKERIVFEDFNDLTTAEREEVCTILTKRLNEAKGVERDKIVTQIDGFIPQQMKNELWESNHNQVTWAISALMQENGRMPTKAELATKTGLSRQTIHKHIKEYSTHPQYLGELERFRFMSSKVLAKVFQFAVNGDVRAAKLYFEVVGGLKNQNPSGTLIQQQNNYIQINGMILSQESIKQLNPEQLMQIESIVKTALPDTGNGQNVTSQ